MDLFSLAKSDAQPPSAEAEGVVQAVGFSVGATFFIAATMLAAGESLEPQLALSMAADLVALGALGVWLRMRSLLVGLVTSMAGMAGGVVLPQAWLDRLQLRALLGTLAREQLRRLDAESAGSTRAR
ncbi:MAG: hypothetical protein KDA24_01220 [Deltaproteobacteria bacterium]|nr:hypothetical protein [Deltaproteobacteria bacterium]